jgi:hypothetical protein
VANCWFKYQISRMRCSFSPEYRWSFWYLVNSGHHRRSISCIQRPTGKLKSLENLIEIELKTRATVQDSTSAKRYFDLFEKIMSDHNEEMRKLRGS